MGDAENLAELGYDAPKHNDKSGGSFHVDVAVIRIVRAILEAPARIAYGGVLRDSANFVSVLHDTAAAMPRRSPDARDLSAAEIADPETPLINWVIRARLKDYPARIRAELTGLCRLVVVGDDAPDEASQRQETARALSEMRARVAASTDLTLVVAGKRRGFSGVLPGVAEEAAITVNQNEPDDVSVVLLGEFGGMTRDIVRYILDPSLPVPPALELETHCADPASNLAVLFKVRPELRQHAEAAYTGTLAALDHLRAVARRDPSTQLPLLGIDVGTWCALMRSSGIGSVVRTLRARILPCLRERGQLRGRRVPLYAPGAG